MQHKGASSIPVGGVVKARAFWLTLALLAVVLPHLLPAATVGALDLLAGSALEPDSTELSADNFPGSAFFYAEGAFDPAPDLDTAASTGPVLALGRSPAAPATPFRGLTALDRYRALHCLTSAIYYEAGNEPIDGQRAVAQVVLNRVRHPAWPNSICGVVYQGSERIDARCQFTFSCDGAMARMPNSASWLRARRVAEAALAGAVYTSVGLATHYHTLAVHPAWADSLSPVAVIGAHIFYRWRGMNGTPRAFAARYSGFESQSGPAVRRTGPAPDAQPQIAPILSLQPIATPAPGTDPLASQAGISASASLPQSTVRQEYRNSGRPIPQARPASPTALR
ncbi:cell wall hydrolase [Sphingobium algorifonticola]|uniref:Cell wall hydrolase n=1 Tax=Sphingobium algorifonticola TaxID=2008318 RepID=A0A437J985_9SPHN|nr:cell wall hydrolase [Sphingobium algorifonticola]RVT42035.1 cell wall hydrolase [Sphingobium algorifonticola]